MEVIQLGGGLTISHHITIFNYSTTQYIIKNGTVIKATADHPVLTQRGWVRICDLKLQDKILKTY